VVHGYARPQNLEHFPPELWTTSTGAADHFTQEPLDHFNRNPHRRARLTDWDAVTADLRRVAEGDDSYFEQRHRRYVAEVLAQVLKDRRERPPPGRGPLEVLTQEFENLRRVLGPQAWPHYRDPFEQKHEKLLALAMAISNNFDQPSGQVQNRTWRSNCSRKHKNRRPGGTNGPGIR
jgi:hypothetical protein